MHGSVDRSPRECGFRTVTTASAEDQVRLLEVQRLDTGIDQLDHRVRTLPERAEITSADAAIAVLRDRLVAAQTEVSDLERAVNKAEADVDAVRVRSAKDEELLISGQITSAKQLEELQHEVASLARRRSDLEEAELEVMEQLESAQSNLNAVTTELGEVEASRATAEARVADAEAAASDDRAQLQTERASLAGSLPADLLALYERVRADHNGVGAAALHRGRCEGCRMELPPSDIGRSRSAAPDEVVRCEECRRILVRTHESGL